MTLALAGSSPAIPATPEQSMLCPGSFYAQSVVVSLVFRFFRKFINDPLAQLAEQLPFKQWVRGSNPRRVTRKSSNPQWGSDVFLIVPSGDPNGSIAAVRWTAASASANAGGSLCFAGGKTQTNPRREGASPVGFSDGACDRSACGEGRCGHRPLRVRRSQTGSRNERRTSIEQSNTRLHKFHLLFLKC